MEIFEIIVASIVGIFLIRFIKKIKDILFKISDEIIDNSISTVVKIFFCLILFRIATLKGRQKVFTLMLKLRKLKIIKMSKNERIILQLGIILLDVLDKFKGQPTLVAQPLLLYPANHSKVYR